MSRPSHAYRDIRSRSLELVDEYRLDAETDIEEMRQAVTQAVDEYQRRAHLGEGRALGDAQHMVDRVMASLAEFGPLTDLLGRSDVEEIFIEGARVTFIDGTGRLRSLREPTTGEENEQVVDRLLAGSDRRLDASSPIVQARVLDNSARLTAVIPPIADQMSVTIRRYALRKETLASMVELDSLSPAAASLLRLVMQTSSSIVISGQPGAGKTSLLSALIDAVPSSHCIRCCEEVRELHVPLVHGSFYEARPPSLDGSGAITLRDLVKAILAIFHFSYYFGIRESAFAGQGRSHLLQDQPRRWWRGSWGGSSRAVVSEARCREGMARCGGIYRQRPVGVLRRPTTGIRGTHRRSRGGRG